MKNYKQRKDENQAIFDGIKIIFAFSKEQLEENKYYQEAMQNNEKLYGFMGGLITKPEYEKRSKASDAKQKEFDELMKNEDFAVSAFKYELNNHEYCYDRDFDVFEYLGVKGTPENHKALLKAKKQYFEELEEY